jgi:hypothetical protein
MKPDKRARRKVPRAVTDRLKPSKEVWQAVWLAHPEAGIRIEQARELTAHLPFDAVRRAMVEQLIAEAAGILLSEPQFAAVFTQQMVLQVLLLDVFDQSPQEPAYLRHLRPEDTWTLKTSWDPAEVMISGDISIDQMDAAKQYAEWQQAYLRGEDLVGPGGRPRGSGVLTRDQLRTVVLRETAARWQAHPSREPGIREVAARIGLSESGLTKALRRRALVWDELCATSFELSFGRLLSETGS